MTSSTSHTSADREKREKDFEAYYREVMELQPHSERLDIVTEMLEKKYGEYKETKEFIGFLRNVEEIFASALRNRWTVEKTQDELIKGEIFLLSEISGVEEEVFLHIYEEFTAVSGSVQAVQDVTRRLMDQYAGDTPPNPECREFIVFVRDTILLFAKTMAGDTSFDEIIEVKKAIIHAHMMAHAEDNEPPLEVLQAIVEEFSAAVRR